MRKRIIRIGILTLVLIAALGIAHLFTHVPEQSDRHGIVEATLYLAESEQQPLFVGFGGGDGGNDWVRRYLNGKRDTLNKKGYAVLAIGYFRAIGTQKALDRISLDAIHDTIMSIAQHPKIDASKIILFGGSRGGELVLNLASRYDDFHGVIAASTAHVSFPALTLYANTSSWTYRGKEVPYVPAPLKTIGPAIRRDLYAAYSMMLEDEAAVRNAFIPVERINGPVLLVSGRQDDQWPASWMSDQILERLDAHDFEFDYTHIPLDGGHGAPLDRFELVYDFLERHFKANTHEP